MDEPIEAAALLDDLAAESERRRQELREIAAELPAAESRRLIVVTMLRDLRTSADIRAILQRASRGLFEAVGTLVHRLQRN